MYKYPTHIDLAFGHKLGSFSGCAHFHIYVLAAPSEFCNICGKLEGTIPSNLATGDVFSYWKSPQVGT